MNGMSEDPASNGNDGAASPLDDHIELVLATRENTKNVGWFISDDEDAIDKTCGIPFYSTVKEGVSFEEADWKDGAVVRQARISWRNDTSISWMERHMEMTQGFMLVGSAPGLMVLGEPTHDRNDLTENERAWPDFSRVKGYIIPPGCGIIIKKGTWHDFPVSVGPDVTAFIINTREVIDALSSMKEPAPMDFGDCYKVRMSDRYRDKKVRFPDPRPFVASLSLVDGTHRGNLEGIDCVVKTCSGGSSTSTALSESNTSAESVEDNKGLPAPTEFIYEYGQGMTRVEAGKWGGAHANKVWVVPVVNVESFVPNVFGPSVQPHLNKAHPELPNRGWRNYGNKQGLGRLGKMFGRHGIPCTAVVSSDLVGNNEVMSLLQEFKKDYRWEIGAHGANNSNAGHADLSEEEEAVCITSSLERLGAAFPGDEPQTWLTPGFSVTNSTPKLLWKAGVETLLDFVDDDVPFKLVQEDTSSDRTSSSSEPLVCLPYSMETNDFSLVLTRNLSPREYAAALESYISQLAEESFETGTPTVVCLGMHTFVAGTPATVNELNKVFARLKSNCNIKWATAQEVTEFVRKGALDEKNPLQELAPDELSTKPHDVATEQDSAKLCIQLNPLAPILLDRNKLGLLLVDFQKHSMCENAMGQKLGNDPSKLRHIIQPTREVLSSFRRAGLPIIHTRELRRSTLSDMTSLEAADGTLIGSEGGNVLSMLQEEWVNDIIDELKPLRDGDEIVIDKPRQGAFYQTNLELFLKNSSIDTLVVCGVTTEACVHLTVRDANDRGIMCVVLEDCTASYFDELHKVGMEMIRRQCGILGKISNSVSVIAGLNGT